MSEIPWSVLCVGAYRFMSAAMRWMKGIGGRPKIRRRHGRRSVLLTTSPRDAP